MLVLRIRDTPERGSETNANAMLRVLLRVGEPCISQGHSCGGDRELGISIEPFKTMRGKIIFRDPPRNFSGTMRVEFGGIKTGNCSDSTLLRSNATPEI